MRMQIARSRLSAFLTRPIRCGMQYIIQSDARPMSTRRDKKTSRSASPHKEVLAHWENPGVPDGKTVAAAESSVGAAR